MVNTTGERISAKSDSSELTSSAARSNKSSIVAETSPRSSTIGILKSPRSEAASNSSSARASVTQKIAPGQSTYIVREGSVGFSLPVPKLDKPLPILSIKGASQPATARSGSFSLATVAQISSVMKKWPLKKILEREKQRDPLAEDAVKAPQQWQSKTEGLLYELQRIRPLVKAVTADSFERFKTMSKQEQKAAELTKHATENVRRHLAVRRIQAIRQYKVANEGLYDRQRWLIDNVELDGSPAWVERLKKLMTDTQKHTYLHRMHLELQKSAVPGWEFAELVEREKKQLRKTSKERKAQERARQEALQKERRRSIAIRHAMSRRVSMNPAGQASGESSQPDTLRTDGEPISSSLSSPRTPRTFRLPSLAKPVRVQMIHDGMQRGPRSQSLADTLNQDIKVSEHRLAIPESRQAAAMAEGSKTAR